MAESRFITSEYSKSGMSGTVSWQAPSNIALIKYWGKHGEQLPMNPSLSFTLKNCHTKTSISFKPQDSGRFDFEVFLDGTKTPSFEPKIEKFFERIAIYLPFLRDFTFKIETTNSFPHSSGIASSASGMSALALCLVEIELRLRSGASRPMDLKTADLEKASFLARLGSGSACRSIKGPIIVWGQHPEIDNSSDLVGTEYPFNVHKNFHGYRDTILLVDKGEKQVSSTLGHELMNGHPFAKNRFQQANANLSKLIPVLKNGNLSQFVKIVESEALSLHAMMMTSMPYFVLMKPNTLEIINRIWKFREETNSQVCFTLDAGANVHVLYPESEQKEVQDFIKNTLSHYCKNGEFIDDELGVGAFQL